MGYVIILSWLIATLIILTELLNNVHRTHIKVGIRGREEGRIMYLKKTFYNYIAHNMQNCLLSYHYHCAKQIHLIIGQQTILIIITSRVQGKSSVRLIFMKYRIIFLITIIISLGQILLSYIANTSRMHTRIAIRWVCASQP